MSGVCKETRATACLHPTPESIAPPGTDEDMGAYARFIDHATIDVSASVQGDVNCPKSLLK